MLSKIREAFLRLDNAVNWHADQMMSISLLVAAFHGAGRMGRQ
jgi:hypothetical protein